MSTKIVQEVELIIAQFAEQVSVALPQWAQARDPAGFIDVEQAAHALGRQIADGTESPWKLLGEAHFHAGAKAVAAGKRNSAINHYFEAYRSFDSALNFTFHGRMVAEKMTADANWPGWITWNRTTAGDDEASVRVPIGEHSQPD